MGPRPDTERVTYDADTFVMGADLSYVNQILDHGGSYADSAGVRDPFAIFADHGANLVRLRLWHSPEWVRTEVYDDPDAPLYSGIDDVARAMRSARDHGFEVLLDLHYSDLWADPGRQNVPAAWLDIDDLDVLADSVYRYTRGVLETLHDRGLRPEMVQVGNEINCGMLSTGAPDGFPETSVCDGHWAAQGRLIGVGIQAVREVVPDAEIVLHVAQPENVAPWFDAMTTDGGVTDFDVVGASYYALWSDQPLESISDHVAAWREAWGKDVMIVETAYPWTTANADGYPNILGAEAIVDGFPATPEGQRDYMAALVRAVVAGGGRGVIYWEPAWISSGLRDLWGTGSSWDNATLFDAGGRAHTGMEFYTMPYEGLRP